MRDLPICERLREARLEGGKTQEALGVLIGLDEYSASARMNQYERGVHVPNYKLLERCAVVLDVPVEYFYARSGEVAELLMGFHRASPGTKKKVLAMLR